MLRISSIKLVFILLICSVQGAFSQGGYSIGMLPAIHFRHSFQNNTALNFRSETRISMKEGYPGIWMTQKTKWLITDWSVQYDYKLRGTHHFAVGYLLRTEHDAPSMSRLSQQYTYLHGLRKGESAFRLATDQSFRSDLAALFRFRARATWILPFSGQTVDVREGYLKFNHEYLLLLTTSNRDFETRFASFVGYSFSEHQKLEIGPEYRLRSFTKENRNHAHWLSINWFLSF